MRLYHYDRQGKLRPGDRLELSSDFSAIEKGAPGSEAILHDLFPEGLSQFGMRYMQLFDKPLLKFDVNQAKESLDSLNEYNMEQTLELTRRAFFNHRQSRLQSLFCFQDADDINRWQELAIPNGKLYEIESHNGFDGPFDSKHLGGGVYLHSDGWITNSTPLNIDCARKYWSGSYSDEPRLEFLVKLPIVIGKEVSV